MRTMKFLLLVFLLVSYETAQAANILMFVTFATKSFKQIFTPLAGELTRRGHTITLFTPHAEEKPQPGVQEVILHDVREATKKICDQFVPGQEPQSFFGLSTMVPFRENTEMICNSMLSTPEMKAILAGRKKFDLVISNMLLEDCALGIIKKLDLPFIYFGLYGFPVEYSNNLRVPSCMPYCPVFSIYDYTNQMSLVERTKNTFYTLFLTWMREWYFAPAMDEFLRKNLGPGLPPVLDIERNASLVLLLDHFSFTYARPTTPNVIMTPYLHCRPAKPLPKDLEDWVEGSGEHGFIYFSLGTAVATHLMPKKFLEVFVQVFSKLKQRVIWRINMDNVPNLPPNVRLFKWLPQQDLLGHPKIRLFITHGGLLSGQEAAYHGVPLLGFPSLMDQPFNLRTVENAGAGIYMKWKDVNENTLSKAVNDILTDPKYKINVERRKIMSRDFQNPPLDTAVYWIEYVLRHDGAPQLRTGGVDLPWYQYYQVDMIALLLVLLVVGLFLLKTLCTVIATRLFYKPKPSHEKKE